MTAMFPDSGVPAAEAKNSLPNPSTVNCNELWYSTSRCQPRFDPAATNAMLAELLNLVNRGEVTYDCTRLDNIERATRYLIQRGLPHSGIMSGGPTVYTMSLDPAATRYADYMMVIGAPAQDNADNPTLNINGLGALPIVRTDGVGLKRQDMNGGAPVALVQHSSKWWEISLVQSQVPLLGTGSVNGWVRTDGNDVTGDGTANTPDKAFKTLNGAWAAIGGRYAQSPNFAINLRLGIPGTYDACRINAAANTLNIIGDTTDKASYKIKSVDLGAGSYAANFVDCNSVTLQGVTLISDVFHPTSQNALIASRTTIILVDVAIQHTAPNTVANMILCNSGSSMFVSNRIDISGIGAANQCAALLYCTGNSTFSSTGLPAFHPVISNQQYMTAALRSTDLAVVNWTTDTGVLTGLSGPSYFVSTNSILHANGAALPGDGTGSTPTGGQFTP